MSRPSREGSASYGRLDEGSARSNRGNAHLLSSFETRCLPVEQTLCELRPQTLRGAGLRARKLQGLNLRRVDAGNVNLHGANLRGADLRQSWLGHANLREACLVGADLRGARLLDANMEWARLPHAQLSRACLAGANLRGANLRHANLRGADLWCARLWGANLSEACLEDANLVGADLRGADLRQATLAGAFLDGARWGATQLGRQCFGQGIGEESVRDYDKAREVYRALREMFESLGQREDARWAYQKEHRMARQTHGLGYLAHRLSGTGQPGALLAWHHFTVWARRVRRIGSDAVTWSLNPDSLSFPLPRAAAMTSVIMMLFSMLLVLGWT